MTENGLIGSPCSTIGVSFAFQLPCDSSCMVTAFVWRHFCFVSLVCNILREIYFLAKQFVGWCDCVIFVDSYCYKSFCFISLRPQLDFLLVYCCFIYS